MSHFQKTLKRHDMLALAFGAMIGWGWVVLAGDWILEAGVYGTIIGFLIGGIAIVLIGLTYAELVAAMPQAGGEHVYSERALGRFASFICTWGIIFGYFSVIAFESVAFPHVLEYILPNYKHGFLWQIAGYDVYLSFAIVGMLGTAVVTWINYIGVPTAALVQKIVVIGILIAGAVLIIGSFLPSSPRTTESLNIIGGFGGISAVIIVVPFLFVGFDVIPQAAEEVDVAPKSIGKLLLLSVFMAVAWYIFIAISVGITLTPDEIKGSNLAVADAMRKVVGSNIGVSIVVIAGMCGIFTSWNAFMIGGSRAIYALAKAGIIPSMFAYIHPKYKTPTKAILLLGGLSFFAPLLGRKALVWFVDAGGLGIIIAYFFVVLSFWVLRQKDKEMPRPFRIKHAKFVAYAGLILTAGIAMLYLPFSPSGLTGVEWLIFIAWFAIGFVFYALSSKKHQ